MNVRRWRAGVGAEGRICRGLAVALVVALFALHPARSFAQNITYSEFKFGVLDHDVHFLGGHESGVDFNPEVIFGSPVSDDMIASAPGWLRWTLQPRPTIGGTINTAGDTDQAYVGATWSWWLVHNIFNPDDGIVLGISSGRVSMTATLARSRYTIRKIARRSARTSCSARRSTSATRSIQPGKFPPISTTSRTAAWPSITRQSTTSACASACASD
jgi:hypothetical protein